MKRVVIFSFFLLIFTNLFLASWYVLHGDLHFASDIARDFLLYEEIQEKIVVLIGARTSSGLFHGPLWLYVNMPAFLLGSGNPVITGWYWILLIILSIAAGFFVAKNLFNKEVAYLYTLMLSIMFVPHAKAFINPHGAMLLTPLFFWGFVKYLKEQKLLHLLTCFVTLGAIIQFQMAVGLPLLLLSTPVLIYFMFKNSKTRHLLTLLIIPFFVINFLLFDIRHEFLFTKQAFHFASPSESGGITYLQIIQDRFTNVLFNIEFVRYNPGFRNLAIFLIFSLFMFFQIKQKKHTIIYYSFLYLFLGFFALSIINKGYLLPFYLYPFFPMVFLIFASFFTSRFSKIFLVLFVSIYLSNVHAEIVAAKTATETIIGKAEFSWKNVKQIAEKTFSGSEKEFGYYIYSPDGFAYTQRYAMHYATRKHPDKAAYSFQKKPITYLFIAPPAKDNPYLSVTWWRDEKMKLTKNPVETSVYPSNYKLETYHLTLEETQIASDPTIDFGIHFR